MLNSIAKIFNQSPKPKSKKQKAKAEMKEKQVLTYVTCAECERHDVTLYKNSGKHFCKEHLPN